MTQPFVFDSSTGRHALPLLVAGQAQKEFFVNEALARIDALLHPVVEGQAGTPPASPAIGECWIVAAAASGEWENRGDHLASWDGTQWSFCAPAEGMLVFDRSVGERLAFLDGWNRPVQPVPPVGGSVIDSEARTAIGAIVDLLATLAIIPRI